MIPDEHSGAEPSGQPQVEMHSRAFERLVKDDRDVVGLLAYALFKQSVWEQAQDGPPWARADRNLTPALVSAFRNDAERRITQVVASGIAAATPDIERTAQIAAIEASKESYSAALTSARSDILTQINRRTSVWPAFGINLLAWVVTLALTVLIILASNGPSLQDTALKAVQSTAFHIDKGSK
jgi:hypothetical protein